MKTDEAIENRENHSICIGTVDNELWTAVIERTRNGKELLLQTSHRAREILRVSEKERNNWRCVKSSQLITYTELCKAGAGSTKKLAQLFLFTPII